MAHLHRWFPDWKITTIGVGEEFMKDGYAIYFESPSGNGFSYYISKGSFFDKNSTIVYEGFQNWEEFQKDRKAAMTRIRKEVMEKIQVSVADVVELKLATKHYAATPRFHSINVKIAQSSGLRNAKEKKSANLVNPCTTIYERKKGMFT